MGMFSWDCKGCGFSLREGADWMEEGVALTPKGSRIVGYYDGYGRLEGTDLTDMGRVEVWHKACFTVSGRPEYSGPSRNARDQGMPNCDQPEPKSLKDVEALRKVSDAKEAEERAYYKRVNEYHAAKDKLVSDCPDCGYNTSFVVSQPKGKLAIRCPNRVCNKLRPLSTEQQAAFRKLWVKYPDMHEPWDDDKVNVKAEAEAACH